MKNLLFNASLSNMYKTSWASVKHELPEDFYSKAEALKATKFMEKVVSPAAMKVAPHGGFVRIVLLGPFTDEEYGRVMKFARNGQLDFFDEDQIHLIVG